MRLDNCEGRHPASFSKMQRCCGNFLVLRTNVADG